MEQYYHFAGYIYDKNGFEILNKSKALICPVYPIQNQLYNIILHDIITSNLKELITDIQYYSEDIEYKSEQIKISLTTLGSYIFLLSPHIKLVYSSETTTIDYSNYTPHIILHEIHKNDALINNLLYIYKQ